MQIDGHTKLCGLIGNPVAHTLSPLIHNTLAELTGISLVYGSFLVDQGKLAEAVPGAFALHIHGMNVTVPYKSDVIPLLSEIDELAEKIGAVNTLVRTEDGFKGYNTDMPGLYRAMCSDGMEIANREVLILGAGGAARAVAFLCASKGASHVYFLNRTVSKAQAIVQEIAEKTGYTQMTAMELSGYQTLPGKNYLVIQSTSVGLAPHAHEAVIEDPAFYEKISKGYDLVYRPADTRFMQLVREHGGEAYNGLKMLLYQGIISFELWNQVEITEEQAAIVYEKLKEACYGKE